MILSSLKNWAILMASVLRGSEAPVLTSTSTGGALGSESSSLAIGGQTFKYFFVKSLGHVPEENQADVIR